MYALHRADFPIEDVQEQNDTPYYHYHPSQLDFIITVIIYIHPVYDCLVALFQSYKLQQYQAANLGTVALRL